MASRAGGAGILVLLGAIWIAAVSLPKAMWIVFAVFGGVALVTWAVVKLGTGGASKSPSAPREKTLAEITAAHRTRTSASVSEPSALALRSGVSATSPVRPSAGVPTREERGVAGCVWMPFDQEARIGAIKIARGGFYVSSSSDGFGAAVIQGQAVSMKGTPDWAGTTINYYPRYAWLTPQQRAAYLGFLNSDRRSKHIGPSYVWLWIYNLERRALLDPVEGIPVEERRWLLDELRGLLATYGEQRSIQRYLPTLIVAAQQRLGLATAAPELAPWPPARSWTEGPGYQLGRLVAAGTPLPADWAIQWAYLRHDKIGGAVWECVLPELRQLFAARYAQRYPGGLLVKPGKRRLVLTHTLAYEPNRRIEVESDAADVERLTSAVAGLVVLLDDAMLTLEPLRKARRSKTAGREEQWAAYPVELLAIAPPDELRAPAAALAERLGVQPQMRITATEIFALLELPVPAKLDKRACSRIGHVLGLLQFGIEPDPRFSGGLPTDGAVLFRLHEAPTAAPSPGFAAALLMLQAGYTVAAASDTVGAAERDATLNAIARHFALPRDETARLSAHLAYMELHPAAVGRVDSRIKGLPEADRHALARVLLEIAAADGHVDPAEVRLLERLYRVMQLDPASLHADIHAVLSGGPARPARSASAPAVLDADTIARKLHETSRVQAVLADIFAEAEAAVVPAEVGAARSADEASAIDGLPADVARVLLAALACPDGMAREAWDTLCGDEGLMPDGALEVVNGWACDRVGEPLLEGDDLLELNAFAAAELGLSGTAPA